MVFYHQLLSKLCYRSAYEEKQVDKKVIEITLWSAYDFIHELSSMRKRPNERSERVNFLIRINEYVYIGVSQSSGQEDC